IFFFQAEDGIRDGHVTGVQTCALPIFASAVGGILEVVEDGKTGVLVEPAKPEALADAIRRLLEDPARARAMGRAGRLRVEAHFAWSSVAERTREVYADAIDEFARTEA